MWTVPAITDVWKDQILGYDEECLTPHMKIIILKWDKIIQAAKAKGQVDKYGFVWFRVAYYAKCCGCSPRTMRRILSAMKAAKYIDKDYKNKGTPQQEVGVKMLACVYMAQFDKLPTTNRGRGQKNFCADCGSRDIEREAVTYKVTCHSCGSVHYQDNKGHKTANDRIRRLYER